MLKIQEEFEVVGVQGGTHDHAAETVGGRFVVAEQIQEADAKHGEVLGGVARTGPAGVFAENDVQQPVALVLDAPVPADGVGDGGGVGGLLKSYRRVAA